MAPTTLAQILSPLLSFSDPFVQSDYLVRKICVDSLVKITIIIIYR